MSLASALQNQDSARVEATATPPAAAPVATAGPVCPYCGETQPRHAADRCIACRGLFEPLSRQATQNAMGPWQVRDERNPFAPGRSFESLRALHARNALAASDIVRGPTTRQFWMRAADVPGIAHWFGRCHACRAHARASQRVCDACGVSFGVDADRQHLGLLPVRPVSGPLPSTQSPPPLPAPPRADAAPIIESTRTPALRAPAFDAPPSAPLAFDFTPGAPDAVAGATPRRASARWRSPTVWLPIAVAAGAALILAIALWAGGSANARPAPGAPHAARAEDWTARAESLLDSARRGDAATRQSAIEELRTIQSDSAAPHRLRERLAVELAALDAAHPG